LGWYDPRKKIINITYGRWNSLISPSLQLPTHKYIVDALFVGRTLQQSLLGDCKTSCIQSVNASTLQDFDCKLLAAWVLLLLCLTFTKFLSRVYNDHLGEFIIN
jgi:hypothetical protein